MIHHRREQKTKKKKKAMILVVVIYVVRGAWQENFCFGEFSLFRPFPFFQKRTVRTILLEQGGLCEWLQ